MSKTEKSAVLQKVGCQGPEGKEIVSATWHKASGADDNILGLDSVISITFSETHEKPILKGNSFGMNY